MGRELDQDELIDCWMLVGDELDLVAGKCGATRLGFALLLRFYTERGRFPRGRGELLDAVVDYVARQVGVQAAELAFYEWSGRTIEFHRGQIRGALGFRECSVSAPIGPFSDQDHLHQILVKHARAAHVPVSEKRRHGMHSLRHTLATRLSEDGTPVEQIADILGHQSVASTGARARLHRGQTQSPQSRLRRRRHRRPGRMEPKPQAAELARPLHVLDERWAAECASLGVLVRYCDDFVILCSSQSRVEEARRRVGGILSALGLHLHPDKTRIARLSQGQDGFVFLGFSHRKVRSWKSPDRYFLQEWPSDRNMALIRVRSRPRQDEIR